MEFGPPERVADKRRDGAMKLRAGSLRSYLSYHLINRHPRFRLFLVRTFFPDRDVDMELCGSRLRINTRKEFGFLRACKLARSNWVLGHELGVLTTLAFLLEPNDTFVDVGANVGLYASIVSRAGFVFPGMKFYAIEPNPDTLCRLRETLRDRNVKIYDCALSNREGELEFCEGAGSAVFGVKCQESRLQIKNRTLRIKAVTLDSLPIEGDSIVLKIDVENHELEVLEGGRKLLMSGRAKAVYLDGYADRAIPGFLRRQGFELFDGHTLRKCEPVFSLLAIHRQHLERWADVHCLRAVG